MRSNCLSTVFEAFVRYGKCGCNNRLLPILWIEMEMSGERDNQNEW